MELTLEKARALLDYDPASGRLTWRVRRGRGIEPGSIAGTINSNGYRIVSHHGRKYCAHRLAWLLVFGRWPTAEIDHIDGNRQNNALANLRSATRSQNMCNARSALDRIKGVVKHKKYGTWRVIIQIDGKSRELGRHKCFGRAVAARLAAAKRFHGEFARST